MNQRIRELAVAAAPVNSNIPHSEWNIPKEFIEKFAELLIRECANRASWAQDTNAKDIGGEVLKHLGVEGSQ